MLGARGVGLLGGYGESSAGHDAVFVLILQFYALDEVTVGILENDQLVCDNAVDDLLLLRLGNVVKRGGFVKLVDAPAVPFSSI